MSAKSVIKNLVLYASIPLKELFRNTFRKDRVRASEVRSILEARKNKDTK